eukprot:scaffold315485_cov13-Tisochrysis_lutea.AAC.1
MKGVSTTAGEADCHADTRTHASPAARASWMALSSRRMWRVIAPNPPKDRGDCETRPCELAWER